jgi:hypothetical protein
MTNLLVLILNQSQTPYWVPILAVIISVFSLWLAYKISKNFARNEFVKKQIETIIQVVTLIHDSPFDLTIRKYSSEAGYGGTSFIITLFEVNELVKGKQEQFQSHMNFPILFDIACNQLLDIKRMIDNPFLPKSIADELEKFYSVLPSGRVNFENLNNESIKVIKSNVFENNGYEAPNVTPPLLREPHGFAFMSLENFMICSLKLEETLISWLKEYNVKEINIRKDFKNI